MHIVAQTGKIKQRIKWAELGHKTTRDLEKKLQHDTSGRRVPPITPALYCAILGRTPCKRTTKLGRWKDDGFTKSNPHPNAPTEYRRRGQMVNEKRVSVWCSAVGATKHNNLKCSDWEGKPAVVAAMGADNTAQAQSACFDGPGVWGSEKWIHAPDTNRCWVKTGPGQWQWAEVCGAGPGCLERKRVMSKRPDGDDGSSSRARKLKLILALYQMEDTHWFDFFCFCTLFWFFLCFGFLHFLSFCSCIEVSNGSVIKKY